MRRPAKATAKGSAEDAEHIFDVDPVAAHMLDPKSLASSMGALTQETVKRYKAETKADQVPPHV